MRGEVDFLPADKHKAFLQHDCITLDVTSQICLNCWKQQVYNIFAISSGKREGWRFLQSDTMILGVCGQACPSYPKLQVWYFSATCSEKSGWCSQYFACR